MSVDSFHPLYAEHAPQWVQMRHCYQGERAVKSEGFVYLPATSAMDEDGAKSGTGTEGWSQYEAYRKRARFPEYVQDAVDDLVGIMHSKPPKIELPPQFEHLRERATRRGESLEVLLRRINTEQWLTGRVGILGDFFDGPIDRSLAYLSLYFAEQLINWDVGASDEVERDSLNLVVLDESENERETEGFTWRYVKKYRVLMLGGLPENEQEQAGATYSFGVFRDDNSLQWSAAGMTVPLWQGRAAEEIPFEFVNDRDVVPEPGKPPLIGLSNLSLSIYRSDADYRQALFMQGQDTLVIVGGLVNDTVGKAVRTGAGARLDVNPGGEAKYIGVDSAGLPEMREALENDHNRAREMSGKLLDSTSRDRESGEALRVRITAKTATVRTVAMAGAFALQSVLRKMAKWLGIDPKTVVIEPNLEFSSDPMSGKELGELTAAKRSGAPISWRTVHGVAARRGVTDMLFEDELAEIEKEEAEGIGDTGSADGTAEADPLADEPPPDDDEGGEDDPAAEPPA